MKDLRTQYTTLKNKAVKFMENGNVKAYLNTLMEANQLHSQLIQVAASR